MKYKFHDHTIIAYFCYVGIAFILITVGSFADIMLKESIFDKELVVGKYFFILLLLFLYYIRFRKAFNSMFAISEGSCKGLGIAIIALALPIAGNLLGAIFEGFAPVIPAIVSGCFPGISEEIMFRGPGLYNYMRKLTIDTALSEEDEEISLEYFGKKIRLIVWISSIAFGLIHLANMTVGASLASTALQLGYAIGIGVLFCAVFFRTGSILLPVLMHSAIDVSAFLCQSISNSRGILTSEFSWFMMIPLIEGIFSMVVGIILLNRKNYAAIYRTWKKKVIVCKVTEEQNTVNKEQIAMAKENEGE